VPEERFRRVDDRFDRLESKIEHIDGRIDTMQRTMLQGVIGLCTVFAAGFAAVIALIATQL
jgi:tetrahydromethanopterin S-methyltransferase subunit G